MHFAKGFERLLENPRKGLQGQEERGREGLGNFPGISRNRSDHGGLSRERDEEEAKQTKESAKDRNKEDKDKATGEEMRERAMERLAQTKKQNEKDEL